MLPALISPYSTNTFSCQSLLESASAQVIANAIDKLGDIHRDLEQLKLLETCFPFFSFPGLYCGGTASPAASERFPARYAPQASSAPRLEGFSYCCHNSFMQSLSLRGDAKCRIISSLLSTLAMRIITFEHA